MRRETLCDCRLREHIRGVPDDHELAECERTENAAEVVVVDEELRNERIDFHAISVDGAPPIDRVPR